MKLDRSAFLALVTALSAAACAAPAADEVDEASGAQSRGGAPTACVDPNVDNGVYPAAEACYAIGESWGQCNAWVSHFYAGVARSAIEATGGGADAYDAGFKALAATCKGSDAAEARLTSFCGAIADKQLTAQDKTMNIRTPASFGYTGSSDRSVLLDACKDLVRGVRIESRPLIRRCIEKTPDFPVYACVEGLGFDDVRSKCEDTNAVGLSNVFDRCNADVEDECRNIDSLFKAKPALDTKSCIQETEIILAEGGAPADAKKLQEAARTCAIGTLARSCEAPEVRTSCDALVVELKDADPQLGTKGHLNAGGAFTKRCIKTFSGLSTNGRNEVFNCIRDGAKAAKAGTKRITDVSLDACIGTLVGAKG